jgi:hypothetical protein
MKFLRAKRRRDTEIGLNEKSRRKIFFITLDNKKILQKKDYTKIMKIPCDSKVFLSSGS